MPRKTRAGRTKGRPPRRFNEAAARCRGKPDADGADVHSDPRFNEAAARCRGKRGDVVRAAVDGLASMRPRPDAAENMYAARTKANVPERFNEAAARCRGKPRCSYRRPPRPACFNEAAARCRGKRDTRRSGDYRYYIASMRPRPDAAENAEIDFTNAEQREASMRPRPDAAENGGRRCLTPKTSASLQ